MILNMKRVEFSICVLSVFFCEMVEMKLQPIPKTQMDVYKSLTNCIIDCIKPYVSSNFERITYSISNIQELSINTTGTLEQILLPTIENSLNKDVLIQKGDQVYEFGQTQKSQMYIVHFITQIDLQKQIETLKLIGTLNVYAKFIMLSTAFFRHRYTIAVEISKYLWSENIFNFIIILSNAPLGTTFDFRTWNPYKNNCEHNFENSSYTSDICSFGVFRNHIDWFSNKIPQIFQQCKIKVHYVNRPPYVIVPDHLGISEKYPQRGIEMVLISTIAETLKLKILYSNLTDIGRGKIYHNNTMNGIFKLLENKEFDIAIGGYIKTPKISILLGSSRSYIQDYFIWCVPHVSATTILENLFTIVNPHTLIVLFVINGVLSVLISCFSRRNDRELRYYHSIENAFLAIFTMFLSSPISRKPRTLRVRELFGIYMVFSFIFSIAYNSCLISHLTNSGFNEKYSTLQSIYENNLKTYFSPGLDFLFSNIQDINGVCTSQIKQSWISCQNVSECLHLIAFTKDSSIFLSQLFTKYYSNYDVKRNIFCLPDSKIGYNVNIVMRKGFPLHFQIDKVISQLVTGGFIQKWEVDTYSRKTIDKSVAKIVHVEEILTVIQMHIVTQLLITVVLVIEIVVNRLKSANKRNQIYRMFFFKYTNH